MTTPSRRSFLAGGLVFAAGCAASEEKTGPPEVSPTEDLMREHGLLNRVLLVYDECARRLEQDEPLDRRRVADAAWIIKRFIEEYHEKLEEEHLFPRFLQAGKHAELVAVLSCQHQGGRRLTAEILDLAKPDAPAESTRRLTSDLRQFVRMYRPHEAREDTVLFPALHQLLTAREFDALGEEFERRERAMFGEEGFEGMVQRTADLEKALGLNDLQRFTP